MERLLAVLLIVSVLLLVLVLGFFGKSRKQSFPGMGQSLGGVQQPAEVSP